MRYDLGVYQSISVALSFTVTAEPYHVIARGGAITGNLGIPPGVLARLWPRTAVLDSGPYNRLVIDPVAPALFTLEVPMRLTATALLLEIHSPDSRALRLSANRGARLLEYRQDGETQWLLFLMFSGHCVEFSYARTRYAVCRSYEQLAIYNRREARAVWEG